jgi:hypothetical protein
MVPKLHPRVEAPGQWRFRSLEWLRHELASLPTEHSPRELATSIVAQVLP